MAEEELIRCTKCDTWRKPGYFIKTQKNWCTWCRRKKGKTWYGRKKAEQEKHKAANLQALREKLEKIG